ncbi:MAG: ATP-binding protein [Saprospiraceae bacterium]
MPNKIIGRVAEQQLLQETLTSDKAELIAVIGRRRVGKTYLIESFFQENIVFQISGIQKMPKKGQLRNFAAQLTKFIRKRNDLPVAVQAPVDWFDAILLLIDYLETIEAIEKPVVFFDELPWIATHKSGFLAAFSYFWNSWAVKRSIIVVICGSAASWMIKKVVHHKGGLHNRITRQLSLAPFTLGETEAYFKHRNLHFDRYQILQLYMTMGGIPHYLEAIRSGLSATQNIEQICFAPTGLLRDEFSKLYTALFKDAHHHITVIRALATSRQGLTRNKIIRLGKFNDGGKIQTVLEELLQSGFISTYRPFAKKKKEKLYRLTDEYSLFYLQFMEGKELEGANTWQHLSQTQAYKIWSGYAFESICLKHVPQIKQALQIGGIYSLSSSYYKKGTKEKKGLQIDLLIDRNDQTINLFEVKFYNETFIMTKAYAAHLRDKMGVFRHNTQTRKQLSWIFLSTFGLKANQHSSSIIAKDLTMDDLFT